MRQIIKRVPRPTPALVVAFVALFAAMGGIGYSAVKMKANSVKTKNLRNAAVTTNKIADGAVTTPKLAPDAVAPNAANAMYAANAANAMNAANAAKLGGVAPGGCQTGWLSGSLAVDTTPLNGTLDEPMAVPGFDCASKAGDAVQIQREAIGQYTVTFAGNEPGIAVTSSADRNVVTAAQKLDDGGFLVKTWLNTTGEFVDGQTFALIAF
jgi:hypothetical protein